MDVRLPSFWKIEGVIVWHARRGDKLGGPVRQGSDETWIYARSREFVVLLFQRTLQECCSCRSLFVRSSLSR